MEGGGKRFKNYIVWVYFITLVSLPVINMEFFEWLPDDFVFYGFLIASSLFICGIYTYPILTQNFLPSKLTTISLLASLLVIYLFLNSKHTYQYKIELSDKVLMAFPVYFWTIILLSFLYEKFINPKSIVLFTASLLLVESILGILQWQNVIKFDNSFFRLGGTFTNPNVLAAFLAIGLSFLFPYIFNRNTLFDKREKVFLSFLFLVCMYAIVLCGSRTGWIGLASTIIFNLLSHPYIHKISKWKKIIILSGLLLCGIMFGKYTLFNISQSKTNSTYGRIFIYKNIFSALKSNPLFGYGFDSFGIEYNRHQSTYFEKNPSSSSVIFADNINTAPSGVLQILFELGILGLTLSLVLIVLILRSAFKALKNCNEKERLIQSSCILTIISFLVISLFSYPMYILEINIILLIILPLLKLEIQEIQIKLTWKVLFNYFKFLICLSILMISIFQYSKRLKWKEAQEAIYMSKTEKIGIYSSLYPHLFNEYLFLVDYANLQLNDNNYSEAARLFSESSLYFLSYECLLYEGLCRQSLKQYQRAESLFSLSNNIVPNRILPKYYLLKLYIELNDSAKAIDIGNKILKTPLKIKSNSSLLLQKDALNLLKKNHLIH